MSKQVTIDLVDDIDGSEAEVTVSFRVEGKDYEIDLSATNAQKFHDVLSIYIKAGRKVSRPTRWREGKSYDNLTDQAATPSSIRVWAKRNGYSMNSRGRIPARILEAYERASA